MMMASMGFPSFCKVLVHDSNSLLRIPLPFGERYEQIMPEDALLQTDSGKTWPVKIERINEHYCFTDGWPNFVKDLQLRIADFLVFWFMCAKKSVFRVAIYGISGCGKELSSATTSHNPIKFEPPQIVEPDQETIIQRTKRSNVSSGAKRRQSRKIENRGHDAKKSDDSAEGRYRFFRNLGKYHRSRMLVPIKFAKKTGVICKRKVKLQYLNGGSPASMTTVQLKFNRKCHNLDMSKGWPEFRIRNNLIEGNWYAFEFISETDSIQVQEVEKQH